MKEEGELIQVGRLGRTRGVRGWLWITADTDFPERFSELEVVLLSEHDSWQEFRVEEAQVISGRPVIKFVGIDSREAAARLTNRTMAVTREQLVPLPEDSHYVFDLVGCSVYEADTARRLGEIVEVLRYPANDVYLIRTIAGKEVLFPAVSNFVRKIDTVGKKITIVCGGMFEAADDRTEP